MNLPEPREGMIREMLFVGVSAALACASFAGLIAMMAALSAGH